MGKTGAGNSGQEDMGNHGMGVLGLLRTSKLRGPDWGSHSSVHMSSIHSPGGWGVVSHLPQEGFAVKAPLFGHMDLSQWTTASPENGRCASGFPFYHSLVGGEGG